MYGYIYEITNLLNGKRYIGKHKSSYFDEEYHGSGKLLSQSIRKNGWENNYSYKILDEINGVPTICESEDELNRSEEFYIDYYGCVESDDFYNLKRGGIGKSALGYRCIYKQTDDSFVLKEVPELELNWYIDNGWIKGRPKQPQEVIDKRVAKLRKPRKQGTGEAISRAMKGKKLSEEHKKNLRKPKKVPNWRKGLITIVKDDIQLSIKEDDLEKYLQQGYIRGAKKHSKGSCELHSLKAKNGIYMSDGNKKIRPQLEDVEKYLNSGFKIIGNVSLNKYKEYISNK